MSYTIEVIKRLSNYTDLQKDEFIILAGEKYRKYIVDSINCFSIPLKGLSIGKQLAFYKGANNV